MLSGTADGSNTVIVIGGGISGLASAALLAQSGYQVTLFEKNETLGGRAQVFGEKGFSFDMGPSWYMMPEVFEHFFSLFNKKTSDYYQLLRLDPRYEIFFADGSNVLMDDNFQKNCEWFESEENGTSKKLADFLIKMEKVYDAASELIYKNIFDVKELLLFKNIRLALSIGKNVDLWRSWDSELNKYFKNKKLKRVLEFSAVFLGGSPYNTPAFYAMLAWADFGKGIYYPKGGMRKVVDALEILCRENGVNIKTNTPVTRIAVANQQVTGVYCQNDFYPANIVIGSCDLPHLEMNLLPHEYQRITNNYWKKKNVGISAVMVYLGINKRLSKMKHHSLYFSSDWRKNFDEILTSKKIPNDPSFYISVRSISDRGIVPDSCEEMVVLIPLGAGGQYSDHEINQLVDKTLKKIEQISYETFVENIVVKKVFTPSDYEKTYNAFNATALGLAHTFDQSLWLRRGVKNRKISGLYYSGQYVHPGIGVPMALISAQLVHQEITQTQLDSYRIFKQGSTTYYFASLFFRGQVRSDVSQLYAYVRTIDDCVDQVPQKLTEFEYLWQQTVDCWNGKKCTNPIISEFISLAKRKGFEWDWICAFWDSMRLDITKKKYEHFSELEKYMYGSAEVIGLMMAKILHLPSEAYETARIQGKAMQFINFIRDVAEDESLGRNYLGYDEKTRNNSQLWKKWIEKKIDYYEQLQKEAEKGYRFLPWKYRVPIKTAADMYLWTAKKINENPQIVFSKKVKPSKWRVLYHLIKNCFYR